MSSDRTTHQPEPGDTRDAQVDRELRERVEAWLADRPQAPSATIQRALAIANDGARGRARRLVRLPLLGRVPAAAAVLVFALLTSAIALAVVGTVPLNNGSGSHAKNATNVHVAANGDGDAGATDDNAAAAGGSAGGHNTSATANANVSNASVAPPNADRRDPIDRPRDRERVHYAGPNPLSYQGALHALLGAFEPLAALDPPQRADAIAQLLRAHTLEITYQRGRGITSLLLTRPVGIGRPLPMLPIILTVFPEAMYLQLRVNEERDPVITLLAAPKSVS